MGGLLAGSGSALHINRCKIEWASGRAERIPGGIPAGISQQVRLSRRLHELPAQQQVRPVDKSHIRQCYRATYIQCGL